MDCPRCHAPLSQDAKVCFNCGLALSGVGSEPEAPSASAPSHQGYPPPQPFSQPLSQPLYEAQATPSSVPPPVYPPSYFQLPYSQPPYSQAPHSQPLGYPPPSYPAPYYAPPSQPVTANPAVQGAPPSSTGAPPTRRVGLLSFLPLILLVGGIWAIAAAFVVTARIVGSGWTDADFVAAIAAFAVAALALAVVITQVVKRRWKHLSFAFNLLLVVALALVGTGGIVFRAQAGIAQARNYAATGDWADAVKQYALLADDPSCGQDCQHTVANDAAHAHYEYGYQLEAVKQYQTAIGQFQAALASSPAELDAVLAHVELSHAHYSYGLEFVSQNYYLEAISEFEQAVSVAPSGPYAQEAHLAAASAYYAVAQQYRYTPSCENAATALEEIVREYADAPEAKQAAADLAAPVTVTGTITGYPVSSTLEVWLSKKANVPKCCGDPGSGNYSFSEDYKTTLDAKTGNYVFHNVIPGSYTVSTFRQVGSSSDYTWWYANSDPGTDLLFVQVGPVCPFTWTTLECDGECG